MLTIHKDSHLDHHVIDETKDYLLNLDCFKNRDGFFVETIEFPEHLPALPCDLHGPIMGDQPVPDRECFMAVRGERAWPSRLCYRSPRLTRRVTVVAGPHDGLPCVLYTVYGGPPAPREPGDYSAPNPEAEKSAAFWREHALSAELDGYASLYVDDSNGYLARWLLVAADIGPLNNEEPEELGDQYAIDGIHVGVAGVIVVNRGVPHRLLVNRVSEPA